MRSTRKTSYMRRTNSRQKLYRKLLTFFWKGFEITVWNNKRYCFKYEYTCRPVTNQTMNMVKKELPYSWEKNSLNDVTSHVCPEDAVYAGKRFVCEFMSLSWKLQCKGRLE